MKTNYILSFFLLLMITTACAAPEPEPVTFTARPENLEDQIAFEVHGETAIISVFSKSGIGGAGIALESGERPSRFLIRFYLSGLEEMQFAYGETLIASSMVSRSDYAVTQTAQKAGKEAGTPIAPDSPYWMETTITPTDGSLPEIPLVHGYIEVELPADFIAGGETTFGLRWVDFYR